MKIIQIGEPGAGRPGTPQPGKTQPLLSRVALFRLGFRPFYLGAALFALISVPLWLAAYGGHLGWLPAVHLLWHMHEMVYGFAAAVVIGFLFTGARNWTGLWTPRGGKLAALVALWLAGRIAMLTPWPLLAAAVDLWFIPLAIVPLYDVMKRSGKRRNVPLLALPGLLFVANLAFHASVLGWSTWPATTAIEAAILVLAVLSIVMGGRVIPGFTANMAPGSQPKTSDRADRANIVLAVAASVCWTFGMPPWLTASLAAASGALQLGRLACWSPQRTVRYPLLWVLHLAYAWIAGGFLMLAATVLGIGGISAAMHAIAIGGMSALILGMITRTAIGHTGHPMRAERYEGLIFAAMFCAAVARVLANALPLAARDALLGVAAAAWMLAFAVYLVGFAPLLCKPRVDGREG
jgi:uncharacterized protein involved in response to NO